jgi:hypothetical protein
VSAESEVEISDLLKNMTGACTESARLLSRQMADSSRWESDIPCVYTIPKMSLSVKLGLSFSKAKVKGIFFSKSTTESSVQALSTINLDIVAVPRSGT